MPTRPLVLVTGATGLAGRALLRELNPVHTRALRHRSALTSTVATVPGDLRDPASLREAVRGIDVIVHSAALMEGTPDELHTVNVEGSRALAHAAREAGVRHLIFLSTGLVYRPGEMLDGGEDHPLGPAEPYGHSKLEAERVLRDVLDDRVTILRLPSLYESAACPFTLQLAVAIRDLELPFVPGRTTGIELLHVDDLARAVATLVDGRGLGGTYNLGFAPAPTYRELIDTAANALQLEPRWVPLHGNPEAGPEAPELARFAPLLREAATTPRMLSSARAHTVFGYSPRCDWRVEIPRAMRAILANLTGENS